MNNHNLNQLLQQGFHIAIGALTSLVETAQDPEKRTELLSQLQMELNLKTREWAVKGETTEQEARRIVDNFLHQQNRQNYSTISDSQLSNNTNLTEKNDISSNLQQLKDEIMTLRIELTKMRESQE